MNLPNKITVGRFFLVLIFLGFLWLPGLLTKIMALLVCITAGVSDYLDGYYARKLKLQTPFGQLMDPLADKIFISAAFIAFVGMGLLPAWVVILVISREFLITGLRLIAATQGTIIQAKGSGKHKTVYQLLAIGFILLKLVIVEWSLLADLSGWKVYISWYDLFLKVWIYLVVVLSVYSGLEYLYVHRSLLLKSR